MDHDSKIDQQINNICVYCVSGNKILNKMGLSLLPDNFWGKLYKAPALNQAEKDIDHFRHPLRRFVAHVTQGEELTEHEEKQLTKLGTDCSYFLKMKAYESYSYTLVLSNLIDLFKKSPLPQVGSELRYSIRLNQSSFMTFVMIS